jgi:hypothetical protein
MKEIALGKGKIALVDDVDFLHLALNFSWSLHSDGYAYAYVRGSGRKGMKRKLMHQVVAERMGLAITEDIDHEDQDRLNNQRFNLRAATRGQNNVNSDVRKDNKLGVKGVYFCENRYVARISVEGINHQLGRFLTLKEADEAYRAAKKKYYPNL